MQGLAGMAQHDAVPCSLTSVPFLYALKRALDVFMRIP